VGEAGLSANVPVAGIEAAQAARPKPAAGFVIFMMAHHEAALGSEV
jgi:DNA-binding LytR/AlgR family response regulator